MKALRWYGTEDLRVESVPDPEIEHSRDAIVKISTSGICGSDLHLYDGLMPTMEKGDILGHEPMGEVVEVGRDVHNLKEGDRVVVPFTMSCGECFFCKKQLYSLCDSSNPNAEMAQKAMGQSPAGLFGYSHLMGGFPGGQAQYLRVPYADFGPVKIESGLPDERVVFLSDIFPTGYMAAENCDIEKGDTVAVWGCGPVGQFAIKSAWMLGAERVIAIDRVPERLRMAEKEGKAETIVFDEVDSGDGKNDTKTQHVYHRLMEMTHGRGPDRCIDAVGAEAHGTGSVDATVDRAKMAVFLGTDRPHVLREAIFCCRKGGRFPFRASTWAWWTKYRSERR
jgi:threonine dehydrogenase-like Zn-dependent dehydrogenase